MKNTEKITVVIVPVKAPAYVKTIDNKLDVMQEIVGGYIETAHLYDVGEMFEDLTVVCNDKGWVRGLPLNKLGIRGQFFLISSEIHGDGEMVGIEPTKAKVIAELLNSNGG